jgi:hypothetical protein
VGAGELQLNLVYGREKKAAYPAEIGFSKN